MIQEDYAILGYSIVFKSGSFASVSTGKMRIAITKNLVPYFYFLMATWITLKDLKKKVLSCTTIIQAV
jgi:hypothetical protein